MWRRLFFSCLLFILFLAVAKSQVLEAAYCQWDDQFDEWQLHINEDEFVEARRQIGANPYRKWDLSFENATGTLQNGFMELKRDGDLSYWDFFWDNERLSVESVYMNDIRSWKIKHQDKVLIIEAENTFLSEWEKRSNRGFQWKMYMVNSRDIRDLYIDDESTDEELSFPMRIAAAMIVIEILAFGR